MYWDEWEIGFHTRSRSVKEDFVRVLKECVARDFFIDSNINSLNLVAWQKR